MLTLEDNWEEWILPTDGSSSELGRNARLILEDSNRYIIELALCFNFKASNNKVKYKAVVIGLKVVRAMGAKCFE